MSRSAQTITGRSASSDAQGRWDVIANPRILSDLGSVVIDPRAIGMTVLLSGFLTLSYLVVYAFMRFEVVEER